MANLILLELSHTHLDLSYPDKLSDFLKGNHLNDSAYSKVKRINLEMSQDGFSREVQGANHQKASNKIFRVGLVLHPSILKGRQKLKIS